MTESVRRKPPLPLVQSFVACREIFTDERTGTVMLVGITSLAPLKQFPAHVRLSLFVEFTGGHGQYLPRLELRDGDDEVVWGWGDPRPIEKPDPLLPHQVTFYDLMVAVPRPGRYVLALHLNGEVAAERSMWFGPTETFRS
jgi:hypothetical protein